MRLSCQCGVERRIYKISGSSQVAKAGPRVGRWCANSQAWRTVCPLPEAQDLFAGVAAGIGAFCAVAADFLGPSSQLNLLVLSKMR